jgi:hypothetical protein
VSLINYIKKNNNNNKRYPCQARPPLLLSVLCHLATDTCTQRKERENEKEKERDRECCCEDFKKKRERERQRKREKEETFPSHYFSLSLYFYSKPPPSLQGFFP